MAERENFCLSCKKKVSSSGGAVKFLCPNCGKYRIIRCKHCREAAIKYKCPECGFWGPN